MPTNPPIPPHPTVSNIGDNAITFPCQVARIQTMADGGLRFTLDAPETVIMQAALLMECKRAGVSLEIIATPDKAQENKHRQGIVQHLDSHNLHNKKDGE